MQKVIRRSALAKAQAERRLARRKERDISITNKTKREQENYVKNEIATDIKAARLNRREDWELGPLAPRRDVGLRKDTYGTVSSMRLRGKELTMEERVKLNPDGGRYPTIIVGDRVVLLHGRDKGKIGKIVALDARRQEVTVAGLNRVDVAIPKWMRKAEGQDNNPIRSMEQPISLASVKLVVPLPDPETGVTRDVIVKRVVNGNIFHDKHTGRKNWTRFIAGLNIVIPWPKIEAKKHKDYDSDTLRIDVEANTFVPTLLRPPMPSSVVDELRNKYSKFRTKHDEEYILKKMREDEEKEAKKTMAERMMTPLKEKLKAEGKLLKAKDPPNLTPGMLAKIGEVIARNRSLSLPPTNLSTSIENSTSDVEQMQQEQIL